MPFDAEMPTATLTRTPADVAAHTAIDPAPHMAHEDPQQLLAFLYVSPRPCAALDALLGL